MKTVWLDDIKDSVQRENFKQYVENSKSLLDKLKKICYNSRDQLLKSSPKDLDLPNWPLKRAYQDGQIRQLEEMIELLTLDRRED